MEEQLNNLESEISDFKRPQIKETNCTTQKEYNEENYYPESIKQKENQWLIQAAKYDRIEIVDFLIHPEHRLHKLDFDYTDSEERSAVDYAWEKRHYDILVLLMEVGFQFSKIFPSENISAVDKNHLFHIYAILKSRGKEQLEETERTVEEQLQNDKDKMKLASVMVKYFPSVKEAHIHDLISKSRTSRLQKENERETIQKYYQILDSIPEVSVLLKVLQHENIDIIFDFDSENLTKIYPPASVSEKGLTKYFQGRLYIGAKGNENYISGILAHEIAHMAHQIVYGNETYPYEPNNDEYFTEIRRGIIKDPIIKDPNSTDIEHILYSAIEDDSIYHESEKNKELIVRVPQTLTQFRENNRGRNYLTKHAFYLFHYYKHTVVPKFRSFIRKRRNYSTAARRVIRYVNKTIGGLGELEKLQIENYKIYETDHKFLNSKSWLEFSNSPDKKIFLIVTKFILLEMFQTLHCISRDDYTELSYRFLIFDFKNFIKLQDSLKAEEFDSDPIDKIIIRFDSDYDYNPNELHEGCQKIKKEMKENPNKKFVLIMSRETEQKMSRVLPQISTCSAIRWEESEETRTLAEVTQKVKQVILSKELIFANQKMKIQHLVGENEGMASLCGVTEETFHELITANIIEEILENKEVDIGSETPKLEGVCIYVGEKINIKTFKDEFLKINNSSSHIYLVKRVERGELIRLRLEKEEVEVEKEGEAKQEDQKWLEAMLGDETGKVIHDGNMKATNEQPIFIGDQFSDEDFINFCTSNREKKIYFIEAKVLDGTQKLYLRHFYHPFYIRSFRKLTGRMTQNSFEEGGENLSKGHKKTEITEDILIQKLRKKKVFILVGKCGEGKISTLNKLLQTKSVDKQSIADNHWVIKINSKESKEIVSKIVSDKDNNRSYEVENFINMLEEIKPPLKTVKNFLKAALDPKKAFPKPLLFIFSNLNNERNTILKYFKENVHCKLWATTSHSDIETDCTAYKFIPPGQSFIKLFFEDFFIQGLKLTFDCEQIEKLLKIAKFEENNEYSKEIIDNLIESENIFKTLFQTNFILMYFAKKFNGTRYFQNLDKKIEGILDLTEGGYLLNVVLFKPEYKLTRHIMEILLKGFNLSDVSIMKEHFRSTFRNEIPKKKNFKKILEEILCKAAQEKNFNIFLLLLIIFDEELLIIFDEELLYSDKILQCMRSDCFGSLISSSQESGFKNFILHNRAIPLTLKLKLLKEGKG